MRPALSLGERVDRDGVFTSRRGPGEGSRSRDATQSMRPSERTALIASSLPGPRDKQAQLRYPK